jgi:hypothetical protein
MTTDRTAVVWTERTRDEVYGALCRAIADAGETQESLFLARLCLLLVEELRDPDAARRAIAEARLVKGEA